MNLISYYSNIIETCAVKYEVHRLPLFLTNLSRAFHSYYANNKVVDPNNKELSNQRFMLVKAVKIVLANGLKLMSIQPANKM
jgi:arginyl-tRNA synthetase